MSLVTYVVVFHAESTGLRSLHPIFCLRLTPTALFGQTAAGMRLVAKHHNETKENT